jgi:hypothetical protein
MLIRISDITKIVFILLSISVLALVSVRSVGAVNEVRILWPTTQLEGEAQVIETMGRRIREETGIQIIFEVVEVRPGRQDELIRAVERARYSGVELVFGLTRSQVLWLEGEGLSAVRETHLGKNRYRSLQVLSSRYSSSDPRVLGVPISLSLPIICVRRDSPLAEFDQGLAISTIAFKGVARRISIPDPRIDTVGLSVLLSSFLEGEGTSGGWEIFSALDRNVKFYPPNFVEACEAVAEQQADLGFTMLGIEEFARKKWPQIKLLALDRAIPVPVYFASRVDNGSEPASVPALQVLRWLSDSGLDYAARELENSAPRDFRLNTRETLYHASQLNYF